MKRRNVTNILENDSKVNQEINFCDLDNESDANDDDDNVSIDTELFAKNDNNDDPEISQSPKTDNKDLIKNQNEYLLDSSDEEDIRNTIGNVPIQWYKDYEHIGYDVSGKKIIKPVHKDEIDNFLKKMDDPLYWRTVQDKLTGQSVVLTDKDVQLVQNIRSGKSADPLLKNPYEPWIDFFTNEVMQHPISNRPMDKRSFIPSSWERLKVGKLVHAIKMGWLKPKIEEEKNDDDSDEGNKNFYDLWSKTENSQVMRHHIPAPKLTLPGNEESYNPAPEYLFSEKEEEEWKNKDPETRRIKFVPKKYNNLRSVPSFSTFINERFQRCLDLYLCPRQRKMKLNVDPRDLIPKLPSPNELQPFPTVQSLVYKGHSDLVRTISIHPLGQWLVSGSDDQTIRFWEISTGRCLKTIKLIGKVISVAFNPNTNISLIAAAVNNEIILINPLIGDKVIVKNTNDIFEAYKKIKCDNESIEWKSYDGNDYDMGFRLKISHIKTVKEFKWHSKGDYFAIVLPNAERFSVCVHQLSKHKSQHPFKKPKGLVQTIAFHPIRPFFFVATQRYIRMYNLLKQELVKKCLANCKWISSLYIHPRGDNFIVGSYDCRLCWFDLDMSTKPYKTLQNHKKAIRKVTFHNTYPLFASVSDDCSSIVYHGQVYSDLMTNALIVPVKILRGHGSKHELGILDCAFHPQQPWLFTSGADSTIRLYTS